MVLVSKFTLAAALSVFFGVTTGQVSQNLFKINQPSTDLWWIEGSDNTMAWDCKNAPVQQFTVFLMNTDSKVLSGRLAFIAQESNTDCSKLIPKTQLTQPAANGYKIQFADILNGSNVYAESEIFEIKAAGSSYPTSTPGGASSTGSASTSTSTGSSKKSNDASNIKTSMGFGLAAIGAVLGFMTA